MLRRFHVAQPVEIAPFPRIAILRKSVWAILLLPFVVSIIQREVIGCEERYLERAFGAEYLAYKRRVRRWV